VGCNGRMRAKRIARSGRMSAGGCVGAATPALSIIVPVKEMLAEEMTRLTHLASSMPPIDVIAVGKVSIALPREVDNLKILDRSCSIYEAMNLGAAASAADYLLFMGIDDELIVQNAAKIVAELQPGESTSLIILPFVVGRRLVKQGPTPRRLRAFHHQGVLFHRETLLRAGGYGLRYRLHSDLDLMLRIQRQGTTRGVVWPLVRFAKGGATTSGRHSVESIKEFFAIYRDHELSCMRFDFAFSVALLVWYRIRFLLRNARASIRQSRI
jgi:hypothetical protein